MTRLFVPGNRDSGPARISLPKPDLILNRLEGPPHEEGGLESRSHKEEGPVIFVHDRNPRGHAE